MNGKIIYDFIKEKVESEQNLITINCTIPTITFYPWDKCSENDSVIQTEYTDHTGESFEIEFYKKDFNHIHITENSIVFDRDDEDQIEIEFFKKISLKNILQRGSYVCCYK